MKYKYILNFIAFFASIAFVATLDNYYSMLVWYGGNFQTLFDNLSPFNIIELIVLLLCIIGGIKKIKILPLVGIFYIKTWLFYSITLLNKYLFNPPTLKVTYYSWADPFYFNNVFLLNWLGAIAFILLSITCILGVIMLIKDKFSSQA